MPERFVKDPSGSQTNKSGNQIFVEEFKDLDNSSIESCTIFKVNTWLRESNPNAYIPKMVSIGPYHKKNSQLYPMKKYKLLYLRRFLQRKEGLDEESCISKLEKWKTHALKCYVDDVEADEFCKMLLLDGCFVIEFIRECCGIHLQGEDKIIKINAQYIFRDLMLLENQLPFFILDQLHHMAKQDGESSLAIIVCTWLPSFVEFPSSTIESFKETPGNIKHLLDLVHTFLCHGNRKEKSEKNDDPKCQIVMPNATELSEAGVSFAKASDTTSLFDIKFENGLMTIPRFRVDNDMETLLRNLITYEQQSWDVYPQYFSDFATFMDHLIDSNNDVALLRQKGIIVNFIGEDKKVASLYNKIGSEVTVYSNFYYKEEFKKAAEYSEKPGNRMKANLKHNYFSSPWKSASTVAAIILLILTAIQTVLAFIGPVKK